MSRMAAGRMRGTQTGPEASARFPTRLKPIERVELVLEIVLVYLEVRWRLWRTDLTTTLRALRAHPTGNRRIDSGPDFDREISRFAVATTRTLRLLPADSRCLMTSLVLMGILSRRRMKAVLVIGVSSEPDFQAHAWVERESKRLLPDAGFERLVEL